jgi:hypothetical protein
MGAPEGDRREALFFCQPSMLLPIGGGQRLVAARGRAPVVVDESSARIAAACRGARTIQEHSAIIAKNLNCSQADIARALNRLRQLGVITVVAPMIGGRPTHARIHTVTIVTADRPVTLRATISTIKAHAAVWDRKVRFRVIDGSHDSTGTAEACRADGTVDYYGPEAVRSLHRDLTQRGVPPDVVAFGLTPGSIGSNRNLGILAERNALGLFWDDDVSCFPWVSASRSRVPVVAGHEDLREWDFFRSRHEALDGLTAAHVDVLAEHEQALRQSVGSMTSRGHVDVSAACGHILEAGASDRGRVRVSMAGLAGDSGRYCHHRLLFVPGHVRSRLLRDPGLLSTALNFRELRSIATSLLISHEPVCMSYCMGFDGSDLLPPFIPLGRGEDTLFGYLLSVMSPGALFAHLPVGITHLSDRCAELASPMPVSSREIRLSEALQILIGGCARTLTADDPERRLTQIGQAIMSVASGDSFRLSQVIAESALESRASLLANLERSFATAPIPQDWREAADRYRETFARASADSAFDSPVEFQGLPHSQRAEAFRVFAFRFGELLSWWPRIWQESPRGGTDRPPISS